MNLKAKKPLMCVPHQARMNSIALHDTLNPEEKLGNN
jgi:hypothetical protein